MLNTPPRPRPPFSRALTGVLPSPAAGAELREVREVLEVRGSSGRPRAGARLGAEALAGGARPRGQLPARGWRRAALPALVPPSSRPVAPEPGGAAGGGCRLPGPASAELPAGSGAAPARPWGCAPPASSAAAACCPSCCPQPQVRPAGPAPGPRSCARRAPPPREASREGRRVGKVLGVRRGRAGSGDDGSPAGVPGRQRLPQPSLQPEMLVSSGSFSLAADGVDFCCRWRRVSVASGDLSGEHCLMQMLKQAKQNLRLRSLLLNLRYLCMI